MFGIGGMHPVIALVCFTRRGPTSRLCDGVVCSAAAQTGARAVCESRFSLGNWWTWTYRDAQGEPSSWERYTVVAAAGTTVVIEMSSKFTDAEPFQGHHRMTVNVAEALTARDSRGQWALQRFSFKDGDDSWRTAPQRDNVQAFEEKFDCFAMLPLPARPRVIATRSIELPAVDSGRVQCCRTSRHEYTGAWHIREPRRHAGVAAFKSFGPEGGPDTFTFQLTEIGNDRLAAVRPGPAPRLFGR